MIPRSLPLRVDPVEGESWLSYTGRVADLYAIPVTVLLGLLVPGGQRAARYPLTPRFSGIAATEASYRRMADFFLLDPEEVRRLHLHRFDGSALTVTEQDSIMLDPLLPRATTALYSTTHMGLLHTVREPRSCPHCRTHPTDADAITWRLGWHVICLHHGVTLVREQETPIRVPQEHLDIQADALARLAASPSNAEFFHDAARIRTALRDLPEHDRVITALTAAAYRGFPAHQRTILRRPLSHLQTHRITRAPARCARSVPWSRFPRITPFRLLTPALEDLGSSHDGWNARAPLALMTAMSATGCTLDDAVEGLHLGYRRYAGETLRILTDAEEKGHTETLWSFVRDLADQVVSQEIDYDRRRDLIDGFDYKFELRRLVPRAHTRMISTWLREQWAGDFTRSAGIIACRPSCLVGELRRMDDEFGDDFRELMQTLTADRSEAVA